MKIVIDRYKTGSEEMTIEETINRLEKLKSIHNGSYAKDIDMAIKALKQTRWIPVSERLPEKNTTVLGITNFNDVYKTELYYDCGESKWYADGNFDVPIVAWMPFEPYKESEVRDE